MSTQQAAYTLQDLDNITENALSLINKNHLLSVCEAKKINKADLFAKTKVISQAVSDVEQAGIRQYGVPIESKPGPRVIMEFGKHKKEMIMFASNDYLNLSTDLRVHETIVNTLKKYGVGAGSSRVGTGYSYLHKQLEEKLAAMYNKEAAIVFPTGYDAIASISEALITPEDRVILDSSSHACILDSAYNSRATLRNFSHNNIERLEHTLKNARDQIKDSAAILVIIEGAYSMDGDIAKLPEIIKLTKKYNARLLIDEAHSIGVYGKHGYGLVEHFHLEQETDMIGGTFSKSLGATGGFIASDKSVIDYLNYISRKILFSAAFPPILAATVFKLIEIMEEDVALKEKLWENVNYLSRGLEEVGVRILGKETASIPVFIGNDAIMFRLTRDLVEAGIFTFPIVYPSVPKGKSIFRLALQSQHSKNDLDFTIEIFDKLLHKYDVI